MLCSFTDFVSFHDFSSYLINNITLVRDLGGLFDNKLTLNAHYEYVIVRTMKSIGLIRRMFRDFRDVSCLKPLVLGIFCKVSVDKQ